MLDRSLVRFGVRAPDRCGLVVAEEGHFMEAHCERCSELHSYPGNELLLCDGPECGAAWHLHCLRPKLAVVPVGDWLCPTCSTKRRAEMRLEEANSIEKILDERRRIEEPRRRISLRVRGRCGGHAAH